MCTPDSHTFLYTAATTRDPIPVGLRCCCGRQRWGADDELRALDEVAGLEAMLAVPWHELSRGRRGGAA